MLHMHVPKQFWGDAIVTTCYLINCLPSSILHRGIPHSVLYPTKSLFSLPPRVFGCVAFIHVPIPGQDKLAPRATKCVLVGYSRTQKG